MFDYFATVCYLMCSTSIVNYYAISFACRRFVIESFYSKITTFLNVSFETMFFPKIWIFNVESIY